MTKSYFNWSSGKDSSLALYRVLNDPNIQVDLLVTTLSQEYKRVSMHGISEQLLVAQTRSIGIPLRKIWLPEMPDMAIYDQQMSQHMLQLKESGYEQAIFGDIFLEDLRQYREEKLNEVSIGSYFPLWKRNTKELLTEFISLGFKAVLVCVDERCLDRSFVGRTIDEELLFDLPNTVDPCGENGEFHTFVFDGPIFKNAIPYRLGEVIYRQYDDPGTGGKQKTGFWYQDLSID